MKIGIFGSRHQKEAQIKKIFDILNDNQIDIYIQQRFYDYLTSCFDLDYPVKGIIDSEDFDVDMVFSIGGDGTFLRTASVVQKKDIPILGINTGRLGFLADITDDDLEETLNNLLQGKYKIEERTTLMLSTKDKSFDGYNYALNEIAILKQDTASMLTIHVHINGEYLTSYQADGLIVATPTGSTAYSMSVGGPIMIPSASDFILTAIAPHSLTTRPLVVSDSSVITLDVESRNDNFLISVDGRSEVLPTGVQLRIEKGHYSLKAVKRLDHTFYDTLREKLMWGADSRMK